MLTTEQRIQPAQMAQTAGSDKLMHLRTQNRMSKTQRISFWLLLVALLPGCQTIRRGSTQVVPVASNPSGAMVEIQPGGQTFETPSDAVLARRHSHVLRFEKDGYKPHTVTLGRKTSSGLFRNVIWIHPIGWIIGTVVDLSSGSAYDLLPAEVSVELEPAPRARRERVEKRWKAR